MTSPGLMKTIARFDPVPGLGEPACDEHYRLVHIPLAREMLGSVPSIRRYSTWRVTAQYDAAGGWNLRPKAWRFATQLFEPEDATTGQVRTAFPAEVRNILATDHLNCLCRLRRFDVDADSLVDNFVGQHVSQTFVFAYERRSDTAAASAQDAFRELAASAASTLRGSVGLREITRNVVTAEAEARAMAEPGQQLTGALLADTAAVGFLEISFDAAAQGHAAFARSDVRHILQDRQFAVYDGYQVTELVGFDKR